MAARNFGRVNVSVTASTGGLTSSLSRAGRSVSTFAGQVTSSLNPLRMLSSVAKSTFGQLALFSMARGAINTLTGMASAAAENVDVQSKLSRRLGLTYSELAGLKLAGDLAGVGIDTIGLAMTKADVAMQKAAAGSKTAKAAFATLGLTAEQLQGMSSADRFEAIASAISQLATPAERSAAAVALFGRSGASLLPLFEGGADSIRKARKEAEAFGLTLTNTQAQNVENMNDSFTRVYSAIQGIVQQVVAHLAPAITGIAQQFTDFVGSVGGANIGQAIGDALLDAAEYLAGVGDYLIANFGPTLQQVFDYLSQVGGQWNAVFGFADRVAAAFTGAFQLLQSAGSAIGLVFSRAVEQLAKAGAAIASVIPGGGNAEKFLKSVQAGAGQFGDSYAKATEDSFKKSMANFNKAIYGDSSANEAGQAIATPLTDAVRGFRQSALDAASAIDQKTGGLKQALSEGVTTEVRVNTEALKAIVVGTSEGQSFANSLARGADPRLEGDAAKDTARNTEQMVDQLDEIANALGMGGGLGMASIQV